MKSTAARMLVVALAVFGFAAAGPAQAISINYTVDGWGPMQFPGPYYGTNPGPDPQHPNGYPGDTVELMSFLGTLELTPGSYVQKINTLLWTVDYTWAESGGGGEEKWEQLLFNIDATRGMYFGNFGELPVSDLNQTGLLEVNYDTDYLSFADGPTTAFLVEGFRVDVTPLGLARVGARIPFFYPSTRRLDPARTRHDGALRHF